MNDKIKGFGGKQAVLSMMASLHLIGGIEENLATMTNVQDET
jgi:hypothetical protein